MFIRKTLPEDLATIATIFNQARAYMSAEGNAQQWDEYYPLTTHVEADMAMGCAYVCVHNDAVVGSFFFAPGPDPDYHNIRAGAWSADSPYYVIHRIATDSTVKGVGTACFEWAKEQAPHLRIDTHQDNATMLYLLDKLGFKRAGKVDITNAGERIAFEYLKP